MRFARSRRDKHRRKFINVAVPNVGQVELASIVLAKGREIYQRDVAAGGRDGKKLSGDVLKIRSCGAVVVQRENFRAAAAAWAEIIAEHINALERGKLRAAINVTANDRPPSRVRIVKNWIDPWRIRRRSRRRCRRGLLRYLNQSLAISPPIIFAAAGICRLLDINFFATVLYDIADKHPDVYADYTVSKRITLTA